MSVTASPTRRVLGDKDANASLNLLSPRKAGKLQADPSALLSPLGRINVTSKKSQIPSPSPRAGQKRRISEVDGAEAEESRHNISASQQTIAISEASSNESGVRGPTGVEGTVGSGGSGSMTSFGPAHQEETTMEPQFELPADEMSQTTLEKMHEVPMPQNFSSSEVQSSRPGLRTEDSQLSLGMSSLVDFGGSDNSQASEVPDTASVEAQSNVAGSETALNEEEERKAMMVKKAAELRTRLQFAYFKVQTNQTTTPFSRLKVPEAMKRIDSPTSQQTLSVPQRGLNAPILPVPKRQHFGAADVSMLEERISTARARATGQPRPAVHQLSSLPVPKIVPHTRTHQIGSSHAHSMIESQDSNFPSSPPLSRASADIEDQNNPTIETPQHPGLASTKNEERSVEQLSSPPASHDGSEEDNQQTPRASSSSTTMKQSTMNSSGVRDTPSSAIKGEVADSLLQLMRGVGGSKGMCGV